MSSNNRVAANRQNARSSTGPRTSSGKAAASRNSRTHGLAVPIYLDEAWSDELDALGGAFIADAGSTETYQARMFAASTLVDLQRIDRAEVDLLNAELTKRGAGSVTNGDDMQAGLCSDLASALIEHESEAYIAKACELQKLARYRRRAMSRWRRAFSSLPV
jgi:hypothetical protein